MHLRIVNRLQNRLQGRAHGQRWRVNLGGFKSILRMPMHGSSTLHVHTAQFVFTTSLVSCWSVLLSRLMTVRLSLSLRT
jgi:hypothetical protein